MKKPKIVVVGSSNTDMVIKVPKLPAPGETVLGSDFLMAAGGKGANQAVGAARLGADVTFIARVGADVFGEKSIENFKNEGINTDYIVVDQNSPSGVALIFVDEDGENVIAVASGANNNLSVQDVMAAREVIEKADVLLLQLEIPLDTVLYAAQLAAKAGVKVILNPAPAQKLSQDLLASVSVLTPNESEAEILSGVEVKDENSAKEAAESLLEKGVSNVIITMGSKGSALYYENQFVQIPSKKIEAVDTTAAGDAFNGALAYALGSGNMLPEAVKFANYVGALSATKMGAQPSMPTQEEVKEFINSGLETIP
ncbi:MAG TPA: ribokinase [Caldithrix abyssi]|uniref:Ribokinase n=1 Tax=Caldithrix abyssi TaxID=187145 RepID=A0A7V5H223_CALAY|nr:ribokinase [Caldithrix abyssi]